FFFFYFFFFQAEDGIRDFHVTGVQTCALPICEKDPWNLIELRLAQGSVSASESPPAFEPDRRPAAMPSRTCHRRGCISMANTFHPATTPASQPASLARPALRPLSLALGLAGLMAVAGPVGARTGVHAPVPGDASRVAPAGAPAGGVTTAGGFGAAPMAETPQSISVVDAESLEERGARTLSQAIRLETSVA